MRNQTLFGYRPAIKTNLMIKNLKSIITYLFALLIPASSLAQIKQEYSSWNSVIIDSQISEKFFIKNEVHFRRTHFLRDWQQFLIRPSLHYKFNKSIRFTLGYTFVKNYRNTVNFNENNIWEQFELTQTSFNSKFKHHFRFEQRFIQQVIDTTNIVSGTKFNMRFRYRFTWIIPLFKLTESKKITFTFFDEIWLNTQKGIVPRSLNQNWFYIGLGFPIFKKMSIGIGYMSVFSPKLNSNFTNNNLIQTTLKYHI